MDYIYSEFQAVTDREPMSLKIKRSTIGKVNDGHNLEEQTEIDYIELRSFFCPAL